MNYDVVYDSLCSSRVAYLFKIVHIASIAVPLVRDDISEVFWPVCRAEQFDFNYQNSTQLQSLETPHAHRLCAIKPANFDIQLNRNEHSSLNGFCQHQIISLYAKIPLFECVRIFRCICGAAVQADRFDRPVVRISRIFLKSNSTLVSMVQAIPDLRAVKPLE